MANLDITIRYKYYALKDEMEEAYRVFNSNPTKANSAAYGVALNKFQDFCVAYVARLLGDESLAYCYQEET